jgi:hypothetical protein
MRRIVKRTSGRKGARPNQSIMPADKCLPDVSMSLTRCECALSLRARNVSRVTVVRSGPWKQHERRTRRAAFGKSRSLRLFSARIVVSRLVLPHRIELWTSPLPRECSTTELRQRPEASVAGLRPASHRDITHVRKARRYEKHLRENAAILATGRGPSASGVAPDRGGRLQPLRPRALT